MHIYSEPVSKKQVVTMKCPASHPLQFTKVLPSRYINGQYVCDICRRELCVREVPLWHCDICSHDVCLRCSSSAKVRHDFEPTYTIVDIPTKTIVDIPTYTIVDIAPKPKLDNKKCPSGHRLTYTTEFPKPYSGSYKCNVCGEHKTASDKHPVWRCFPCDYDMCDNCSNALVRFGHLMPEP